MIFEISMNIVCACVCMTQLIVLPFCYHLTVFILIPFITSCGYVISYIIFICCSGEVQLLQLS